eukprot:Platyproteum_vivax@DN3890_c0_g1_i1.p1
MNFFSRGLSRLLHVRRFPTFSSLPTGVKYPSNRQLRAHFFNAAIPMLGFGFMDNLVMIQAGEYIDTTLGVAFGLSTITAAAFGQVFSDVSGVCFGSTIEACAIKLGIPYASFSSIQRNLGIVKVVGTAGRVFGVITGCLLGMTCLLLIDVEMPQRKKRLQEFTTILNIMMASARKTLDSDIKILFIDSESNKLMPVEELAREMHRKNPSRSFLGEQLANLWRRLPSFVSTYMEPQTSQPLLPLESLDPTTIIPTYVVRAAKPLNVKDVQLHPQFSKFLKNTDLRGVLCYPIFDEHEGSVIGVLELSNKHNKKNELVPFDQTDEKLACMLCEHLALYVSLVLSPNSGHSHHKEMSSYTIAL